MDVGAAAFLFGASAAAGAVNSIAGGGTLLSFPAAVAAGLPPIVANATNAVAMVPGSVAAAWTFRRELAGHARLTLLLVLPALAGGLAGAAILRRTPERLFASVVPWLVLGATLVILFQELILGIIRRARPSGDEKPSDARAADGARALPPRRRLVAVMLLQALVAIYGGYFGAAMGIVMLAFLGLVIPGDLRGANALKNVLAVAINGIASVDFVAHGLVRLPVAALMASGAIVGGVAGARMARRASPILVRRLVVAIGFGMTALLAYRAYR
jgi:uncharacterized membrane protein YfcA